MITGNTQNKNSYEQYHHLIQKIDSPLSSSKGKLRFNQSVGGIFTGFNIFLWKATLFG